MSQHLSFVALCVGLCLGLASPASAAPAGPGVVRLRPRLYQDLLTVSAQPRDMAQVAELWRQAEHVLSPHDPAVSPHTLALTRATLDSLRRAGLELAVEPASVQAMVDDSYAHYDTLAAVEGNAFFGKVQPLDAIEKYLTELVDRSGGRARFVTIGRSIQGRDLRTLLISSRPGDGPRASIIVTGAQHAREWLSPMVVMGIAEGLVAGYEGDERVRRVVDHLDVYLVPVMNPDGYVRTFNGNRLQRKNMREGCNVDINRNFPTAFGQRVSRSCTSETTPGMAPFSEPESQALRTLAEKQTRLRLYVDYHSAGNQVMIPYAYTRDEPPGFAKNQQWGNLLASKAMLPARPAFALAQGAGGGSLDWFREKYTESLVVELPGRGFDPPSIGVAASVERQWQGWLAVAEMIAAENPAAGVAVDAGVTDAAAVDASAVPDGASDGETTAGDAALVIETLDAGSREVRSPAEGRDAGAIGGSIDDPGEEPSPANLTGGCAVARRDQPRALAPFLLLALALLLRRRR